MDRSRQVSSPNAPGQNRSGPPAVLFEQQRNDGAVVSYDTQGYQGGTQIHDGTFVRPVLGDERLYSGLYAGASINVTNTYNLPQSGPRFAPPTSTQHPSIQPGYVQTPSQNMAPNQYQQHNQGHGGHRYQVPVQTPSQNMAPNPYQQHYQGHGGHQYQVPGQQFYYMPPGGMWPPQMYHPGMLQPGSGYDAVPFPPEALMQSAGQRFPEPGRNQQQPNFSKQRAPQNPGMTQNPNYHHQQRMNYTNAATGQSFQENAPQSRQPTVSTQQSFDAEMRRVPESSPQGSNKSNKKGNFEQRMVKEAQPFPQRGERKKLCDNFFAYPASIINKTAQVFAGEQLLIEDSTRPLAIKIVPFTEKRRREAKHLVKLTPHVNVVSIWHSGLMPKSFQKTIFLAMEQCQNLHLEAYYASRREEGMPFNTLLALQIGKQVMEGINHIHTNEIIHRDLKPTSVLLSLDGKNVKIIDFGMSKELEKGLTLASLSTKIGDDGYRAPETYEKDKIRRLADIFSLAILLYYIWSYGEHPYGNDPIRWCSNIRDDDNRSLANLLVPDAESATDLLQNMLVSEDKRYNIAKVLEHPYSMKDEKQTLISDSEEIWKGSLQAQWDIKYPRNIFMMYRRKDYQKLEFEDKADIKCQLKYLPGGLIGLIPSVSEQKATGHMALSKDVYITLMVDLQEEDKIAWIDMFNKETRVAALLILRPKGHEEMYGILMRKPGSFVASIQKNLKLNAGTTSNEVAPAPAIKEPKQTSSNMPRRRLPQMPNHQPKRDDVSPAMYMKDLESMLETKFDPELDEAEGSYQGRQTVTPKYTTVCQPEYISWWVGNDVPEVL